MGRGLKVSVCYIRAVIGAGCSGASTPIHLKMTKIVDDGWIDTGISYVGEGLEGERGCFAGQLGTEELLELGNSKVFDGVENFGELGR